MLEVVYDFLSVLFDKLKEKEKIRAIILFGSVARGTARRDSDIDLFIDVNEKDERRVNEVVRSSLNEFEIKAEKTWKLREIKNAIVPVVGDLMKTQWKELRSEITSYGTVLYGEYRSEKKEKKRQVLIQYDTSKTEQGKKVQLLRKLLGYSSKKKGKVYAQQGMLQELRGEKISTGILLDIHATKTLLALLKEYKVPFTIQEC